MTRGLLLVDIGSPDEPTPAALRRYLREFLSDQLSIDLSPVARWVLLNFVILPFRPKRSAAAYRKVWTERGAPLLVKSFEMVSEVARALEGEFFVQLAMRYGNPSIRSGLLALKEKGVDELVLFPLHPQYSLAMTASVVKRVEEVAAEVWPGLPLKVVPPFHGHPAFLDAYAEVARATLERRPDHWLFSFHGVPIRHVQLTDATGAHCMARPDCCDAAVEANARCYRAHSFAIARALATRLGLADGKWSVAFQSRLTSGWVPPFTDEVLVELPRRGVKRVAVVCPTFCTDNLETLEEIAIRGKESFVAAGGEELYAVSCLNAHPMWIRGIAQLSREAAAAVPASRIAARAG